jgi:arylsulfatase A-like enzyme
VSWHYLLPEGARLQGTLRSREGVEPGPGTWRLTLLERSGEQRELASHATAALRDGREIAIDLDLAAHAGQMVGLQASFQSPAAGVEVEWGSPRIAGVRHDVSVPLGRSADPPNVLVVLFDTLRRDALSVYGNQQVRTPSADRLAGQGFVFEDASSNATWTKPSVASLWSGLRPSAHRTTLPASVLPEHAPYLPELMREAGYQTLVITANAYYAAEWGFDRGVDRMVDYYRERPRRLSELKTPERQAEEVWQRFLAPAFEGESETPLFAILHELDPHSPYEPVSPYDELYDFGYRGNLDSWQEKRPKDANRLIFAANRYGPWLEPADVRQLRALYHGEVSAMDTYLGRLLDRIEERGLRKRTLVVLLSDHGEQFFEHGIWGHGGSVHQEELGVPLIFSLPGVVPSGARSDVPVQLVDVMPTILDLVGVASPAGLHGRSLVPEMLAPGQRREVQPSFARSNLSTFHKGTPKVRIESSDSVRLGNWKLVRRSISRRRNVRVQYELYDLSRDPGESLDVWPTQPVVGHTLRQLLETRLRLDGEMSFEAQERPPEELSEEVLQNLRELGYIE